MHNNKNNQIYINQQYHKYNNNKEIQSNNKYQRYQDKNNQYQYQYQDQQQYQQQQQYRQQQQQQLKEQNYYRNNARQFGNQNLYNYNIQMQQYQTSRMKPKQPYHSNTIKYKYLITYLNNNNNINIINNVNNIQKQQPYRRLINSTKLEQQKYQYNVNNKINNYPTRYKQQYHNYNQQQSRYTNYKYNEQQLEYSKYSTKQISKQKDKQNIIINNSNNRNMSNNRNDGNMSNTDNINNNSYNTKKKIIIKTDNKKYNQDINYDKSIRISKVQKDKQENQKNQGNIYERHRQNGNTKDKQIISQHKNRQQQNKPPKILNNTNETINPNHATNTKTTQPQTTPISSSTVSQNRQNFQKTHPTPLQQNNLNKIVSQMMLQNNQYLHRLNQSVVNRLLNIIQHNQSMSLSRNINYNQNMSMKNSRWKSQNQGYGYHNIRQISHHKNLKKQQNCQQVRNQNYQHTNNLNQNVINQPNQPQHPQIAHQQQLYPPQVTQPNTITINNYIPTSTKSQPIHTQPHHTSSSSKKIIQSTIQQKQIELFHLQNKRNNSRIRQFNYKTARNSNKNNLLNNTQNYGQGKSFITNNNQKQILNNGSQSIDRHNLQSLMTITPRNQNSSYECNASIKGYFGEQQYSQIKFRKNRQSIHSTICGQILQNPFESQKEQNNQFINKNQKDNNQNKINSSIKYKQNQQNQKRNNTYQAIKNHDNTKNHALKTPIGELTSYNSQQNIKRKSQTSIQLPISKDQNTRNNIPNSQQNQKSFVKKQAVYMQISSNQNQNQNNSFSTMSLAQAFKKRIGKLPTKAQRKAKQIQKLQKQNPSIPNENNLKLSQSHLQQHSIKKQAKNTKAKSLKPRNNISVDVQNYSLKNKQNNFVTPKSAQPSQQLLNRLIGGSKAKVPKKQMYALTRKNYENLPQVQQKKKNEMKKQLELQRLQRIKQYQKSIRASKATLSSNN